MKILMSTLFLVLFSMRVQAENSNPEVVQDPAKLKKMLSFVPGTVAELALPALVDGLSIESIEVRTEEKVGYESRGERPGLSCLITYKINFRLQEVVTPSREIQFSQATYCNHFRHDLRLTTSAIDPALMEARNLEMAALGFYP